MPNRTAAALYVTLPRARAAILAAQGLATPFADLESTLAGGGLVRTLGGVDVYLALRARMARVRRADVDVAVAAGRAAVTPAVRGCIYLASAAQQPLCLALARRLSYARDQRDQEK